MKFISHLEISPGDVIAWAYDSFPARKIGDQELESSPPPIIYYEVSEVSRNPANMSFPETTVVSGRSFSSSGERWLGKDRNYDLVPFDGRDILLISRSAK